MKTGRNDPCPCGSGKKYKHCCLKTQTADLSPQKLTWRRIRRELEGLPPRMFNFTDEVYGPGAIDEAWWEFMSWDDDEQVFDPNTPHIPVFMPWFLHCWRPDPDETRVADSALHGVPPTQTFLARKGRHLAPVVRTYLQSCLEQAFSFYDVVEVSRGHGLVLRDLLTGERHDVREASASQSLNVHDVMFGQLAQVDGVTMLEAACNVVLPADNKVEIIELRKAMREEDAQPSGGVHVAPETLRDWQAELLELYVSLSEHALYPPLPRVTTSDGDEMEFHTLVYDIDSAQQAFDALRPLAVLADEPEFMEADIVRKANGDVRRASFGIVRPEHDRQAQTTPLLAMVHIDGKRMTIDVNSRSRVEWLKDSFIPEALGTHATLRADKIESIEHLFAERDTRPPPAPQLPPDDPEVRDALAGMLQKHYDEWIDTPVPMLNDRTPRDVAVDADGREQVAAMLDQAQKHNVNLPAATRKAIFDSVRAQLGLAG